MLGEVRLLLTRRNRFCGHRRWSTIGMPLPSRSSTRQATARSWYVTREVEALDVPTDPLRDGKTSLFVPTTLLHTGKCEMERLACCSPQLERSWPYETSPPPHPPLLSRSSPRSSSFTVPALRSIACCPHGRLGVLVRATADPAAQEEPWFITANLSLPLSSRPLSNFYAAGPSLLRLGVSAVVAYVGRPSILYRRQSQQAVPARFERLRSGNVDDRLRLSARAFELVSSRLILYSLALSQSVSEDSLSRRGRPRFLPPLFSSCIRISDASGQFIRLVDGRHAARLATPVAGLPCADELGETQGAQEALDRSFSPRFVAARQGRRLSPRVLRSSIVCSTRRPRSRSPAEPGQPPLSRRGVVPMVDGGGGQGRRCCGPPPSSTSISH